MYADSQIAEKIISFLFITVNAQYLVFMTVLLFLMDMIVFLNKLCSKLLRKLQELHTLSLSIPQSITILWRKSLILISQGLHN